MKKLTTLFTLFILLLQANAQDKTIVNFVATKVHKSVVLSVYLNDINVGAVGRNENLQVKMQSTGRISIIFLAGSDRFTKSIDVEKGKEYFFEVNYWISRYELFDDKEEGKEAFNSNDNTFVFEEEISNPIGKLDKNALDSGPKQGSGFLVNKEGFILTNFHVIDGAEKIEIRGIKGEFNVPFTARLVAVDRHSDLALLQVESKLIEFKTPPYTLLSSDSISKAENVFALGYPMENAMGSEVKVTNGIVNSLTGFKQSISEVQISAAVQGGNSGGPLFNSQGELIGVISAKLRSDVADQVSYAIKSNYLKQFLKESGATKFSSTENKLSGKNISEQVSSISNFVYLIKTE